MKLIPEELKDHILPFNWDVRLVWALHAPTHEVQRWDLDYLLDLPLWSSVPNQGMLFDISPMEVIRDPARAPHQIDRLQHADISFPMDMLERDGKRWFLDGVHRLAKMYLRNQKIVNVRIHSAEAVEKIRTG